MYCLFPSTSGEKFGSKGAGTAGLDSKIFIAAGGMDAMFAEYIFVPVFTLHSTAFA
jgi:hypothetical protein